jgi:c-di-GMP phosphodiesterase
MSEIFVARQPIFNRRLEVAGYELLFRGGKVSEALVASPEGATAAVVLNSFTEIGLERIVGSRTAWVNVTREFVLSGFAQTMPADLVMLEILEHQLLDDQLIAAVVQLKRQGYRFALDDFEYSTSADPVLPLVDVVKLDILALGRENLSREIARLKPYGVTVLAEKVETHADHIFCAEAGCDLFQGFFFCKPQLVRGRRVAPSRLPLLQLVAAMHDPAIELSQLDQLIARDLTLSYRLLRYINSSYFGLVSQVRSIRQALALLGVENLKRWATLSVFASIDDKPPELTVTALVRGRFCERAGASIASTSPGELFTLGLFSVIDALMDAPIEEVLAQIPFPGDMRDALITRRGQTGRLLDCVTAFEAGDFDRGQAIVPHAGELYVEALAWANDTAGPLFPATESCAA